MKKKEVEKLSDFKWDNVEFFGDETEVLAPNKPEEDELEDPPLEFFKDDPDKIDDPEKDKKDKKDVKDKKVPKKSEKSKEDLEDKDKDKDKKEKEEKDITFFGEPEDPNAPSDDDTDDEKFFNVLAKGMKDKGVLSSVEIPKDTDLTEDDFVKLYEDEIDNRISETFEGFFEELDNDAKAFLRHKRDGGSTQSFFNVLKDSSNMPKGDLDDISFQKLVAKHYLKTVEELDPEDVDDKIEWLEETGKLEKYSEKYDKKLKAIDAKQKKTLEAQRKADLKAQEDSAKAFIKDIKTTLKETDNVMNFSITKSDKKELVNYITKPEVKVGKNRYVTGLQDGLKKIMKDNKKLILLAKLIKSDFDTSSIETKAETKKTIEMKQKLSRAKQNNKPSTSKKGTRRNLSDFF